jgi:hypothetical protein
VAQNLQVLYELPAGFSIVEVLPSQGTWTNSTTELWVDLGDLDVWAIAEVRVVGQVLEAGWYTNKVSLTAAELDPHPGSNEIEWSTEVLIDANLQVQLVAVPAELLVEQEARYEARVINQGPHEAREVRLEASWLGAMELVEVELSEGSWELEEGVVVMELGAMGVDEERVVGLVVRALEDGELRGEVRVSSMELDPQQEDNEASAVVTVARVVDLGIEQVGENVVLLGGETRQMWVVRNLGPSVGSGVRVVGEVEAGMELTGLEGSQGSWTNAGTAVSWELGELGVGQEAELELVLRAIEVGWWTNRATVSGQEMEGWPEDNVLEQGMEVVPAADIGVGVVSGLNEVLVVERDWRYEVAVTNRGPSVAQGVELELVLSEGLELVDIEWTGEELRIEPSGVVCELGDLTVGEVVSIGVLVRGMEGSWTNVARVSGLEADPAEEDNQVEWVSEVRREADLRVELDWLGSGELLVEQETRYEARVINQGPHEAREVRLEASWLGAMELVEVELSEGSWELEEGVVVMELGAMGVDEERVVGLVVRALEDGELRGEVRVSSMELDPQQEDNEASAVVTVARVVDLGIEQVGENVVLLGGETRQMWVVRNLGPSVGSGVRVVGEVEAGMELTGLEGSQGSWTNAGTAVSWELGELGVGQEAELELVLRAIEVGWWTNRATVSGQEMEGWPEDNVLEQGMEVVPAADIGVGLVSGLNEVLVVERDRRYEVAVTNRGPSVAQGVELELVLSEGLELVDIEWTGEELRIEPSGVVCELGDLTVGEVVSIGVLVRGMEGSWTNVARVSGLEADPAEEDNQVEWVSEVRREADLRVELDWLGSGELLVEQETRYEARVINQGPHEAREVRLEASWLGAMELVEVELSDGSWELEEGVVVMELGAMGVDEERVVGLVVRALEDGELRGEVRVSSMELDPQQEDNEASAVVTVTRVVDLGIEQVGENVALLGGETRQMWVVRNLGPSVGSGVRVVGEVEAGMELTGLEGSQGSWTNAGTAVSWELGELGVGQEAELELVLRAIEVGWWTNRATVSGQEMEGWPEDNVLEQGMEVVPAADVTLVLDDAADQVIPLGSEYRYALRIQNRGPSVAHHVAVNGSIGAGLDLIEIQAAQGTSQIEQGLWNWDLEELAVGETVEIGLVTRGALAGGWEWTAQASAEEIDPVPDDNWIEWLTEVREESDLGLELGVDRSEVLIGGVLVYEAVLTNQGPHVATSVVLDVEWLGKIELVEVETSRGQWVQMPSRLQVELGDMDVASEAYVRVVVQPSRAGVLLSEVAVMSPVPDPDESNNVATAQVLVIPAADLQVTQTASLDPVMIGDELSYFITVHNGGEYMVPDAQVTVWLPAESDFVTAIPSQGITTNVAGEIEWIVGEMEPGTNASITVTVVPQQATTITNRVVLTSAYVEPDHPNLISELTTTVVDAPPLLIELDGSRIVVSWPTLAQDYLLFATDRLDEPVLWYPDGNPRVIEGARVTVTVKVTNAARFYRLSRP